MLSRMWKRVRELGNEIDAQLAGKPIDPGRLSRFARRWWILLCTSTVNAGLAVGYALWAQSRLALFVLVPMTLNVIYMAFVAGFQFNNRLRDQGRYSAGLWNELRVVDHREEAVRERL